MRMRLRPHTAQERGLTDEVDEHYDTNDRFETGLSDESVEAGDPESDMIVINLPTRKVRMRLSQSSAHERTYLGRSSMHRSSQVVRP